MPLHASIISHPTRTRGIIVNYTADALADHRWTVSHNIVASVSAISVNHRSSISGIYNFLQGTRLLDC